MVLCMLCAYLGTVGGEDRSYSSYKIELVEQLLRDVLQGKSVIIYHSL